MVHRMVSVLFTSSSRIDAVSGEIQFECHKFDGEQNNMWTRIHCKLNSQSVPMEVFTVRAHGNFSITNKWSMYDFRLKCHRVDQTLFELFVDPGMDVEFTRDANKYAESVHTCSNGMSEEEKSWLDNGQMSIK